MVQFVILGRLKKTKIKRTLASWQNMDQEHLRINNLRIQKLSSFIEKSRQDGYIVFPANNSWSFNQHIGFVPKNPPVGAFATQDSKLYKMMLWVAEEFLLAIQREEILCRRYLIYLLKLKSNDGPNYSRMDDAIINLENSLQIERHAFNYSSCDGWVHGDLQFTCPNGHRVNCGQYEGVKVHFLFFFF